MFLSTIFLSETSGVGSHRKAEGLFFGRKISSSDDDSRQNRTKQYYSREKDERVLTICSERYRKLKITSFYHYESDCRLLCHIEHSQRDQQREAHIRCSIASFRKRVHRLKDLLPSHLHILSYSTDIDLTVCNHTLWHRWWTTAFLPQMLQVKST
jgi:hypothetical protein